MHGSLSPAVTELVSVTHRNGLRLQKLVNTLLDFSRIEAGRVQASYEPTDLAALTAELASTFRSAIEKAGLQLIVDCPPLRRTCLRGPRDVGEGGVESSFQCLQVHLRRQDRGAIEARRMSRPDSPSRIPAPASRSTNCRTSSSASIGWRGRAEERRRVPASALPWWPNSLNFTAEQWRRAASRGREARSRCPSRSGPRI